MAVINVFPVRDRPFAGYLEASLPIGIWRVSGASVGDASGGDNTIQFNFQDGVEQRFNSNLYSLEQTSLIHSTGGQIVEMVVSNMDNFQPGSIAPRYAIRIIATETLAAIDPESFNAIRGLILGQSIFPNTVSAVSLSIDNGNGENFEAIMQGYLWSARSINVPGGPRRPANGLFRA